MPASRRCRRRRTRSRCPMASARRHRAAALRAAPAPTGSARSIRSPRSRRRTSPAGVSIFRPATISSPGRAPTSRSAFTSCAPSPTPTISFASSSRRARTRWSASAGASGRAPRKLKRQSAGASMPRCRRAHRRVERFFQKPDGVTRWKTWLRALLEDMFVIDAATLYCQRTRIGPALRAATARRRHHQARDRRLGPHAAALSRRPTATMVCPPAYQQVLKGLPAVNYSARDIIYRPRNVRAHRVYGYSPVQQVLMTVNIALRRQLWQLDYFTEGSIPDALIGVPPGLDAGPDQAVPGLLGHRIRRRPRQAPPRQVRARRYRGQGGADQGAGAQGRFRRVARPHHLLCLFGAAAMGR